MNLDYTIYEQECLLFARTAIIHSSRTAELINDRMNIAGYVYDPADKRTWKYYMNLAGQYHASNKMMQVRSLDNDELIDFTVENMRIHVSTARSYQYGTDLYKELLLAYPKQEALIRGILNPIPFSTLLSANEFQLIWYDTTLIRTGEDNVIQRLQEWIYTWTTQNLHHNYTNVTDDLMHHFFIARISMHLAIQLMLIRMENVGTNYVHDFHIWAHLGSHADLRRYRAYLTRKQVLWLYRNIAYLTHNPGKQFEFGLLIKNLLTERSIPLAVYNAQHSTLDMLETVKPTVRFKRELLNMQDVITSDAYFRTTREILEDQIPLARDNITVYEDAIPETQLAVRANRNSSIPTKVLESTMRDLSESIAFPHSATLLNEWARLASEGRYSAVVSMVNPKNGLTMTMSVKEAFALYLYALWKGEGQTLETVPYYQATMCMRIPRPTFAELKQNFGSNFVTDDWIIQAITNQPDIPNLISTEAFYNKTIEINDATQIHHDMWTYRNHYDERAQMELMCRALYKDTICDFWSGTKYTDFFKLRGWDLSEIDREEWKAIAVRILTTATGLDTTDQQKLSDVQKAMLELTLEMSSYTIQVIRKINDQAIVQLDYPTLRVGDQHMKQKMSTWVEQGVRIVEVHMKRKASVDMMFASNHIAASGSSRRRWVYDLNMTVGAAASAHPRTVFYATGATARIRDPDVMEEPTIKNDVLRGLWPEPFVDTRPGMDDDQVLNGLWTQPRDIPEKMLNGLWEDPIEVKEQLLNGLWGAQIDDDLRNALLNDNKAVDAKTLSQLYADTLPTSIDYTNSAVDQQTKDSLDAEQWDSE